MTIDELTRLWEKAYRAGFLNGISFQREAAILGLSYAPPAAAATASGYTHRGLPPGSLDSTPIWPDSGGGSGVSPAGYTVRATGGAGGSAGPAHKPRTRRAGLRKELLRLFDDDGTKIWHLDSIMTSISGTANRNSVRASLASLVKAGSIIECHPNGWRANTP
jgi:hypothetical protein